MAVIPPDFHSDARKWDGAYMPRPSSVEEFNREYCTSPPETIQVHVHTGPRLDSKQLAVKRSISRIEFTRDDQERVVTEVKRRMADELRHTIETDLPFCKSCEKMDVRCEQEQSILADETQIHMRVGCKLRECDRSRTVSTTVDNAALTPPPWLYDTATGPAWHRRSEPLKAAPIAKPRPKDEPETQADAW